VVAAAAVGCATRPPRSLPPDPTAQVLEGIPVRTFDDDECGPGSLALVLNAAGDPVTEAELRASLPRARAGGVLSLDLMLAARQRGFEAALVSGDEGTLREEVQSGRPAILMLRLLDVPGRRRDIYHFVVVDGFVPGRPLFRVQFGDGQARWTSLRRLERAWKGAGHALLVVRPGESADLRRGMALEAAGESTAALEVYRRVAAAHPRSVRARVNLGNAESQLGRRAEAERAYRSALEVAPDDRDALNNLAWLLLEEGSRIEEAEVLAGLAALSPGPGQGVARDTLGRIQLARGRCRDAEATFAEGLGSSVPLPPEARADLLEGLGQAQRACGNAAAARASFQAAIGAGGRPATTRSAQTALDEIASPP
jgi:hypothetical protein